MHILNPLSVINIIRPLIRKCRKHNSKNYEDILSFCCWTHLGRWVIWSEYLVSSNFQLKALQIYFVWAYREPLKVNIVHDTSNLWKQTHLPLEEAVVLLVIIFGFILSLSREWLIYELLKHVFQFELSI